MLICFPWKGSGGGVVYGCGVWRVKSWVKNVPDTNKYIAIFPIKWGWSPLTYLPLVVIIFEKSIILLYWTPYRGIDTSSSGPSGYSSLKLLNPLIGGLRLGWGICSYSLATYWTPYRGIEMLICFPGKGSGGGVVYRCGVWRVKSWVKNVLNTNKYIAISPIKWGWSRLTYLPLVFIISEKSIILFYWTPYRGIETCLPTRYLLP